MTSPTAEPLIRTTLDEGVLTATIDLPGKKMNVISAELMDALDALMDRVERDADIASVVLTSGKPTFLAGADLSMVRGFTDAAKHMDDRQLGDLCGRLGRQFVRLEASAKPWVAAVNGLALGGGMELALACRLRIVVDEPRTQLGVPEVRWGLLPGAGGTQRLPRLVGFGPALRLLLGGRPVAPAEAVALGIFAEAVAPAALLSTARALAIGAQGQRYDPAKKYPHWSQNDVPAASDAVVREAAAQNHISDEDFAAYPAYGAIIRSVLDGARRNMAEASDCELAQFLVLMRNPVAGRMVGVLYLDRQRADRAVAVPRDLRLERITAGMLSAELWSNALAKLPALPSLDETLPADMVELIDSSGRAHRLAVAVLNDSQQAGSKLVLSPPGPYGRVLELVGVPAEDLAACALLAARLGALAWATPGPHSVLAQLHGRSLDEQSRLAAQAIALPGFGEPAFLDVAACLAGVTPPWSGGPLTWAASTKDSPR